MIEDIERLNCKFQEVRSVIFVPFVSAMSICHAFSARPIPLGAFPYRKKFPFASVGGAWKAAALISG